MGAKRARRGGGPLLTKKHDVLSACGQIVRRFDHDRYLTVLFAPAERRESLFALYAFNHEVAKTAEVVSEPMLGQIRLQWWRESLDGIYQGKPRQHEVVEPLARAVAQHDLSRALFDRLIDARESDLESEGMVDLEALEEYGEATSVGLIALAHDVLVCRGAAGDAAARHVGQAWALTGLLRALPFHARRRHLALPRNFLEAAGVRIGDLFELRSSPALKQATRELVIKAQNHVVAARADLSSVPAVARSPLMLATLAEVHLNRLAAAGFDPLAPSLAQPLPLAAWRLTWAALRRRY